MHPRPRSYTSGRHLGQKLLDAFLERKKTTNFSTRAYQNPCAGLRAAKGGSEVGLGSVDRGGVLLVVGVLESVINFPDR